MLLFYHIRLQNAILLIKILYQFSEKYNNKTKLVNLSYFAPTPLAFESPLALLYHTIFFRNLN